MSESHNLRRWLKKVNIRSRWTKKKSESMEEMERRLARWFERRMRIEDIWQRQRESDDNGDLNSENIFEIIYTLYITESHDFQGWLNGWPPISSNGEEEWVERRDRQKAGTMVQAPEAGRGGMAEAVAKWRQWWPPGTEEKQREKVEKQKRVFVSLRASRQFQPFARKTTLAAYVRQSFSRGSRRMGLLIGSCNARRDPQKKERKKGY